MRKKVGTVATGQNGKGRGRAMKHLAKRPIRAAHDRFLTTTLSDKAAFRMLGVLCDRYKIRSVVAEMDGMDGALIEGSLNDGAIFRAMLQHGSHWGSLNPAVTEMVNRHPGGTYIDVGANIGTTTIPLALTSHWDFYAFEPEPNSFRLLQTNLVRNCLDHVKAYNFALSDAPGEMILKRSRANFGDNWLSIGTSAGDQNEWEDVEIEVETLDRLLEPFELARPIIMKLDTQGAEPLVIKGGQSIFSKADMVATEFWPKRIRQMGTDPIAFFDQITAGFRNVTGFEEGTALPSKERILQRIREMIREDGINDQCDILLESRLVMG